MSMVSYMGSVYLEDLVFSTVQRGKIIGERVSVIVTGPILNFHLKKNQVSCEYFCLVIFGAGLD